jgi:hypothetical protein
MRLLLVALTLAALCAASAPSGPPAAAAKTAWTIPPALSAGGDWEWASAAPGANIYVSYRYGRREGSIATVWIDREYYRNLANLDKSFIELIQFDCDQMTARPLSTPADGDAMLKGAHAVTIDNSYPWEPVRSGTVGERVAGAVCGRMIPRTAKPDSRA